MSMRPQHLYEFGPYRLDTAEQLLLRDGKPVPLTPKAFETLVALVERSGHLVEKKELMKVVWSDAYVEESNLTNNVAAIRKLLGRGKSGRNYIETVPKRGYRFTAPVKELPVGTLVVEKRTVTRVVTEETLAEGSPPKPIIGTGETLAIEPAPFHTAQRSAWPRLLIAFLGVSLAIAGFFIYRALSSKPAAQIESIAVLPFKNESGNPDVEYLSDGMTETLINSLSQLPNLSVKARNSIFRYKDKTVEPQTIAADLSVQAIVTGRVVQRGDELVLYLSLINARDGNHLWGEQYHRKFADLVALQSEIARDVSSKLRGRLSAGDEQRVTKDSTVNSEAFRLYLNGRYHFFKSTETEIRKSIGFFQQALDVDPAYARAYAGMADAYRTLPIASYVPSQEAFPQAKAAAKRALEIDDGLADAHVVLGWIGFWFDWDWAGAESQFKRAIELSPENADSHRGYAHLLSNLGRHDEAITAIERARALDALTPIAQGLEAQFLFYAGRDAEAITRAQKMLQTNSTYWIAHNILGRIYTRKGRYDEAIAAFIKARELSADSPEAITQLGYALAKSGKHEQARATLKELRSIAAEKYVPAYSFAMIHNGLGEKANALKYLEKSFHEREVQMTFIKIDTRWDGLRAEPRFQAMLRGVGLAE
jgi:TolB-like protein/DNA-binding winged helix-turn-helix (wHTH) protein/Tfp pilus assembly protein PilF